MIERGVPLRSLMRALVKPRCKILFDRSRRRPDEPRFRSDASQGIQIQLESFFAVRVGQVALEAERAELESRHLARPNPLRNSSRIPR